jgi:hypothetical protein
VTYNEFQRELRAKGIPEREAYFFSLLYERLGEVEQQLTEAASVILGMANTLEMFNSLSKEQQLQIRNLQRMGRPDGVEVKSVAWDKKLEDD